MIRRPTQERLKKLLHYDPETGVFTWKVKRPGRSVGDVAGSVGTKGHRRIYLDNVQYKAHHLAWLYMTGEWPEDQVDHKDVDPDNNRWENLRAATNQQNCCNRVHPNPSGLKGVSWKRRNRKWVAQIGVDGKRIHLGLFDSAEAAHAAYCAAAERLHGEFANLGGAP